MTSPSANPQPPIHPLEPLREKTETFARQNPTQALSAAFGIGLVLALLPLGTMLSSLGRLALLLLRPILIVLGLVKLYEHFGNAPAAPTEPDPSDIDPV
jgi:hypothetical protein